MDIFELLAIAKSKNASDLHLSADSLPLIRVDGMLKHLDNYPPLTIADLEVAFMQVTTLEKLEMALTFVAVPPRSVDN